MWTVSYEHCTENFWGASSKTVTYIWAFVNTIRKLRFIPGRVLLASWEIIILSRRVEFHGCKYFYIIMGAGGGILQFCNTCLIYPNSYSCKCKLVSTHILESCSDLMISRISARLWPSRNIIGQKWRHDRLPLETNWLTDTCWSCAVLIVWCICFLFSHNS
jgi:hypothetical protein